MDHAPCPINNSCSIGIHLETATIASPFFCIAALQCSTALRPADPNVALAALGEKIHPDPDELFVKPLPSASKFGFPRSLDSVSLQFLPSGIRIVKCFSLSPSIAARKQLLKRHACDVRACEGGTALSCTLLAVVAAWGRGQVHAAQLTDLLSALLEAAATDPHL